MVYKFFWLIASDRKVKDRKNERKNGEVGRTDLSGTCREGGWGVTAAELGLVQAAALWDR